MQFRLLAAAALLVMSSSAFAQLKWEKPVQNFERTPEDGHVEAHFAFKNAGAAPVTIKSLRSSCGCTTARLAKNTYAPGETGEVIAKFTIGDRRGMQVKGVTVTTDDASQQPTVLTLRANIFDPVKIEPALVWWRVGDAITPKTISVNIDGSRPVRVKSATSASGKITATLETVKPGEQYTVSIKPTDTSAKESAEITLETDFPTDAPRRYIVHARIK